ncbi:unnamed protein product [Heterobilharzia americana]|nr:unnamed protein product [Heterobilharzia americana]
MENVNINNDNDSKMKMPAEKRTSENVFNVTTETATPVMRDKATEGAVWTEREQMATIMIAVALVAIITICIILIILRTLRSQSNQQSCGCQNAKQKKTNKKATTNKGEKKGAYSSIINENQVEPKWNIQLESASRVEHASDRIRKVPTRSPENKKWYDSAAIPFMDEVSASLENLYIDQQKQQP